MSAARGNPQVEHLLFEARAAPATWRPKQSHLSKSLEVGYDRATGEGILGVGDGTAHIGLYFILLYEYPYTI